MKKIILLVLIIIPMVSFSQMQSQFQEKDVFSLEFKTSDKLDQSPELTWEDEIQHTRYCLGKYRKEKLTGIWMVVGGGFLAGLSTGLYQYDTIDENLATIGYLSGAASVITGYIFQIRCNRWLKKAAIGPADSGIGVKVSF